MRIASHRAGTYADRGTLQMPCTAGVPSRYGHRHRRCRRRHRGIAACVRADGRMELASWDSWELRVVGLQGEGGTGRFVIVIVMVMPYRYRYRYRYALSASRKGWRRNALAMVDGGGGKNYKLK